MRNLRFPLAIALAISLGGMAVSAQTTTAVPATPVPEAPQTKDLTGDLAKASLAKQGITNSTPAQLEAESKAIADQRAKGMGWGQIAQSLGLNLGQVVSASNHARHEDRKENKEHMNHTTSTAHGGDHGGAGKSTGGDGSGRSGNSGGGHSSSGGGGGKGK